MLLRDRCSGARVRLRLFSELERADLALGKAVEWRLRFALEHSSIRPVASVVLSYSVEHSKNSATRPPMIGPAPHDLLLYCRGVDVDDEAR